MTYYTDWEEAVKAGRKITGRFMCKVSTEWVVAGTPFDPEKIKKEKNCNAVHIVFVEKPSRFELLDI